MPVPQSSRDQLSFPFKLEDGAEPAREVARGLILAVGNEPWCEDVQLRHESGEPFVVVVDVARGTPRRAYEHLLRGNGRITGVLVRVRRS